MFGQDMFVDVKTHVRYWGFLLLKLAGAAVGAACSLWFLNLFFRPYTPFLQFVNYDKFLSGYFDLAYTTLIGRLVPVRLRAVLPGHLGPEVPVSNLSAEAQDAD